MEHNSGVLSPIEIEAEQPGSVDLPSLFLKSLKKPARISGLTSKDLYSLEKPDTFNSPEASYWLNDQKKIPARSLCKDLGNLLNDADDEPEVTPNDQDDDLSLYSNLGINEPVQEPTITIEPIVASEFYAAQIPPATSIKQ